MNKQMIFIALAAGSLTALTQHGVQQLIAHHQHHQDHRLSVDDIMVNGIADGQVAVPPPPVTEVPVTPLEEIGPGGTIPPTSPVPSGSLPTDLETAPGTVDEPGSARPKIHMKQGWSLLDLIPGQKKVQSASLVLNRTNQLIKATKDPIWQLQLVSQDGQVLQQLPALTGRSYRQQSNRHQAGNKSPLPPGTYRIERSAIERGPFSDPELGQGYWIPIQPLFSTGRSALGFHQDPSWGKTNGESGTSGCIGLENREATIKLVEWIKHFNITQLKVVS